MTTLEGNTEAEKLADLSSKNYKAQAIWFLNAFWNEHGSEAEKIWSYKVTNHHSTWNAVKLSSSLFHPHQQHTFDALDHDRKAEGAALDELQAHRFLEKV